MQRPRKVREGRESSPAYTKPRALGGGCPGLGSGLEEEDKNRMQRLQQSTCQGRRASASRVATARSDVTLPRLQVPRGCGHDLELRRNQRHVSLARALPLTDRSSTDCSCHWLSLPGVRLQSPSAATASVQALGPGASGATFTRLLLCGSCTGAAAAAARYVEVDESAEERADATRLAATRVVL